MILHVMEDVEKLAQAHVAVIALAPARVVVPEVAKTLVPVVLSKEKGKPKTYNRVGVINTKNCYEEA